MAAVTANATPRKLHNHGGYVTINNGTDTYTIKNLDPGGTSWQDGVQSVHEYDDEGTPQAALATNLLRSVIEIAFRLGDIANGTTNTIFDLLNTAPTNGLVAEFTVVIYIPDYKGATTGKTITYANCYVAPGGFPRSQSEQDGTSHPVSRVTLHSRTSKGVRAVY